MSLIDASLKEVLVCPCPHHAALEEDEAAGLLRCAQCKLGFAVHEGIPVMLLEEAVVTPEYDAARCGAPEAVQANSRADA
jgi:uncharacterized protein YbaR (Trm112 family)